MNYRQIARVYKKHLCSIPNEDAIELAVDNESEAQPRKTHMLERVFNRALTQALFSGQKRN